LIGTIKLREFLNFNEVSEQIRVKFIIIKIKGWGSVWWEEIKKNTQEIQGKSKISDWDKMKKKNEGLLPFLQVHSNLILLTPHIEVKGEVCG
jgi:hypothetical protein